MLGIPQGTDEWHRARVGKITASRFADVMARTKTGYGAGRKNYMTELLVERLTGIEAKTYQNDAMLWGIELEPYAKMAYMEKYETPIDEVGFIEHDTLPVGASPDGLIGDDGIVEIKCPNTATHLNYLLKNELPSKYTAQVQGQLWITGRKWCEFISYDNRLPEHISLFRIRIERDDEYIENLGKEVEKFLSELNKLEVRVKDASERTQKNNN